MTGSDRNLEGPRDGETFDIDRDLKRLNRQARDVYIFMRDGSWKTLGQISQAVSAPPASVSARLRDLRKEKFGGFQVERNHVADGLWEYRVLPPRTKEEVQLELLEPAE